MIPDWLMHVIGTGGAILVLLAYFLVSNEKVTSASVPFQLINLVGAGLLTTYALLLQGWSLVALNGIWAIIALVALLRIRRSRRAVA
jgi:hypothetical protein